MQSNLANALLSVIWNLPVLLASVAGCVVCLMNLARIRGPLSSDWPRLSSCSCQP